MSEQLINEFKTKWFQGDYDSKKILIKLKKEGYELSDELNRIYESCEIGYGRSESFNQILAEIRTDIYEGKLEIALEKIDETIKEEPNFYVLSMIKGAIFYKMGKMDEAYKYLYLAFTLKPSHPSTSFNLAIYYCAKNMKPEMMRMLRMAVEMGRKNTCSDYRKDIKKEKIFDTYRDDDDFKDEFVSKYPSPFCEKIMTKVLNDSGFGDIVLKIDYELPYEENTAYDLIEIKAYIYYVILEDLDEHGKMHLDYYQDFSEKTISAFKKSFIKLREQLKTTVKTNMVTALEAGIGKNMYADFITNSQKI